MSLSTCRWRSALNDSVALGYSAQGGFETTNWLRGNSMQNCVQNVWKDRSAATPQYYGTCEDTSSGEIALSASRDGLLSHGR